MCHWAQNIMRNKADAPGERPAKSARRRFLKTVPGAVVAGFAAGSAPATAGQPPGPPADAIDAVVLRCAEQVADVRLDETEEALAARRVTVNRNHIRRLREVPLGNRVEPAFSFRPPRPRPSEAPVPAAPGRTRNPESVPLPSSADDLAFLPATSLGALLAARKISSVELTRLFLERLQRYDKQLQCVITLTGDLAMEQAAAAIATSRGARAAARFTASRGV